MISALFSIWLLHMAVMLSPGANTLLVSQLAASGNGGRVRIAALGICTATAFWASSALLGLHAIFLAFPSIRLVLQVAGGLYLVYVAKRLWFSGGASQATSEPKEMQLGNWATYRLGFLTNITNPKAALFFASVFTTALPSSPSVAIQCLAVVVVVTNAFAWHLLLGLLFSNRHIQLAYGRGRQKLNRMASLTVGALGLSMLIATFREARS
jgi:threonine efflux protein